MIYLENVYICMLAPLVVAYICATKEQKCIILFMICGMTSCLLSAYINLFFAQIYQVDMITASLEITPLVEEIFKLLPIVFYLLIFEPKSKDIFSAALMTAIGFVLLENICYLVEHGADDLQPLLIRGFGAGAMHIVCGTIMAYGLLFSWKRLWLRALGTLGMLCIAVTYHAEYNLLMSGGQIERLIGLMLPITTILFSSFIKKRYKISFS